MLRTAFRNCQVAAPLKLDLAREPYAPRRAFRNCQVAAPLKHVGVELALGLVNRLPQLSSCGPIEAAW